MPKLVLSLPDTGDTVVELSDEVITIGRIEENALQIPDVSVSSRHGRLVLTESGDYKLEDLGSTNGTFVNDQPGTEWQLQDGDRVRFGNVDAVYQSENPAQARPIPQETEHSVEISESSQRPAGFANASPFKTKVKKKDPAGVAVMSLSIVAILAFLGAVALILTLQPPA